MAEHIHEEIEMAFENLSLKRFFNLLRQTFGCDETNIAVSELVQFPFMIAFGSYNFIFNQSEQSYYSEVSPINLSLK